MADHVRLTTVINSQGLKVHPFALEIGMKKSQSLFAILGKRQKITPRIAKMICNRFPDVNYVWLLTGEGEDQQFPILTNLNVKQQNQSEIIRHLMDELEMAKELIKILKENNENLKNENTLLKIKFGKTQI